MSIFSRAKKAKKVDEKNKKTTAPAAERKSPPAPCNNVISHVAQDTFEAEPPTCSSEKLKEKMVAAEKTRGEIKVSSPTIPRHRRADSAHTPPSWSLSRSGSDRSKHSVLQKPRPKTLQPEVVHPVLMSVTQETSFQGVAEDLHAFSCPRAAPPPPPRKTPQETHFASSSTSTTRCQSPASSQSAGQVVEHEDEPAPSAPQTFKRVSRSPSQASSATRSSRKSMRLPTPKSKNEKPQPIMEISLPYHSNDDNSTAASAIPTWRYEDFVEAEPPIQGVVPWTPSKRQSGSRSMFRSKRTSFFSVAAH